MYTNNFFQPVRMWLYLKKHVTERLKNYILGALAAAGAIVILIFFAVFVTRSSFHSVSNIIPFYYIGLILGGALVTSRAFSELGNKEKGIDFLMLPASQFEKFLTVFLFTTVGYLIIYHIGWFLTLGLIDVVQAMKYKDIKLARDYEYLSNYRYYWYVGYFFLQSVLLLGSTYFQKNTLIKTIPSMILVLVVIGLVHCFLILCLFGVDGDFYKRTLPFVMVGKQIYGPYNSSYTEIYMIPTWLQDTYLFIVKYLLSPCILVISYFRLKDKEI
ncbi:hypothetical protein SAMN05660909_02832 [Chitinophaga terrae (ex Kim and Jung 2007)]|uniref:Uncharacterized protein n=1 Tax=Chitinophaga terrae (ex Kim and Jung 2007) TaxID=408074 RepID=A0A1H4CV04_9BACT|nr:hypothetical protein [Chitinophaga terrae (ex Kim and Jung 2007)]MDQ0105314.1 hypothetical protein [Chitinophaga terrae (ex Kim and Jung 2007)]GEP90496.1 hypothetical protein CTE07_21410 [Chitinophaga terrae (ex Kim and Jung 2007)]SEA64263.1 hypothetical protein SAMN05660909_02832 [Chitinophaga terrae (ex Kim and Jung 2007)]